jgi:hypothetical protein
MFVNRRWRRRLQALLGRDMADDETSGCPTVNTAGTPRSPTRAWTHRDVIGRRTLRHAIRRRTIRHATTILDAVSGDRAIRHTTEPTARDPAPGDTAATGHTGRCDRRQTIRHATILSCPNRPGNVRNIFGRCPDRPGICSDDA